MSVAHLVEGAAAVGASGAVGAALVVDDPRTRSRAMLGALVLAGVALEPIVESKVSDQLSRRPSLAAAATVAGLALVAVLVVLIRRRPEALALLIFAALPFRVPLTVGGDTANLLVPLYVVIAAAVVAALPRTAPADRAPPLPAVRRLDRVLALVVVLYALQAVYSADIEQAVKNVAFFYVPFAVLYRLLRDVPWSRGLLIRCLYVVVSLALVFAAIGFGEFATKRLLIPNSKVLHANEIKPYFRVNSLFFDPNIYGRFLALTMTALAARLLWAENRRQITVIGIVLGVLWAGLVLSLSQSSFAALLVGLGVLAALRWRVWPIVAVGLVAVAAGVVILVAAPEKFGLKSPRGSSLNSATSGRADLLKGGGEMFRDRPVWGFGSGSFQKDYRERKHVTSKRIAAISHTIPVTIAAEQGAIGLIPYLLLLAAAAGVLFAGLREALRARPPPAEAFARAAAAAAFCALVVHTFVYAAFLEDPLAWVLLGLGVTLRPRPAPPSAAR